MKVALVHDYLREYGGAERVVETLHEIWPEAPLYTSFVDWESLGSQAYRFKNWDIRTSWVQKYPFIKKYISPLRFLAPKIWESFDLSDYDVVISSSGWFMCRGVGMKFALRSQKNLDPSSVSRQAEKLDYRKEKMKPDKIFSLPAQLHIPLHICYIHHPPRNLYGYPTGSNFQKYWPVRVYAAIINFFLRHYDYETAQKVDYFIANSKETARRVQKFYRRESAVIYPPIEILGNAPQPPLKIRGGEGGVMKDRRYYLSVGRLTYSKRIDLAIEACNRLKLSLKVVGSGKEESSLKSIAGPTIEFLGSVSDSELEKLYAGAKALIFCALDEDFGMVPVEAMSHGTPVIALGQGGVLETVVDGKTGIIFSEPNVESLIVAIEKFEKIKHDWSKNCLKQAEKFSKERFIKEIKDFVNFRYKDYTNG